MIDKAHELTDKELERLERRLKLEYRKAYREAEEKADAYFRQFLAEDEVMRKSLADGLITPKAYREWRTIQLTTGQRWRDIVEQLADSYESADKIARSMMYDTAADVLALNYNYSTYLIEKQVRMNTTFTLVDKDTIARLTNDDPLLLKLPKEGSEAAKRLRTEKLRRWNRRKIQSIATQSILQGDSIPKIAKRVAKDLGVDNLHSAVRAARTLMTAAENGGRQASYERAENMGIELQKMWVATLDGRTRHTHRQIDGEVVGIHEAFSNGLEYPADPGGDDSEVYNCRCTMISVVDDSKTEQYFDESRDREVAGMSYEEWKEARGY